MTNRLRAGFAPMALGCVLLACASAGPDLRRLDLDGWIELRSPHFVLMGDVSRSEIERFAEDLAVFVAVVEAASNSSTVDARVPVRIYLTDGRAWDLLTPSWSVAGFIVPRLDGYFSLVGLSHEPALTRVTLLHEYTHFLLGKDSALRHPIWYDEGFAELFSTVRRREEMVTVGTPAPGRCQSLLYLEELDLETVFAPDRRADIEDAGAFYALAWAVTHYLSSNAERRDRMTRFVTLQANGIDWQEAYARSFDVPIDELSRRIRAHVDAMALGGLTGVIELDARKLEVDRDWELLPVAPARVAQDLGDFGLVLQESGWDASLPRAFFARALEIDPGRARARAGFALSRALQGDFEDAYAELERATSEAPEDSRVQLYAGHVHRSRTTAAEERGDAEVANESRRAARRAYRRARDLDPDAPSAWAGLGWSYVGAGDPQAGIEALERARQLGAWDASVNLDLGRLYWRAGDRVRARELWAEVVRIGEEEQAAEAESLLAAEDADDGERTTL